MDHLATQIFELQFGKLTTFKGNYSAYVMQREQRDKDQEAAYEKQQAEIKKDEEFIQKTWFVPQLLREHKVAARS